MKRLIASAAAIAVLCLTAYAQDDVQKAAAEAAAAMYSTPAAQAAPEKPVYWKESVAFNVGFDQLALFNWAAGGNNTVKFLAGVDAKANYAKDLTTWSNRLQMDYGFLWSSDKKGLLQKNNDQIYLESSFAYRTANGAIPLHSTSAASSLPDTRITARLTASGRESRFQMPSPLDTSNCPSVCPGCPATGSTSRFLH